MLFLSHHQIVEFMVPLWFWSLPSLQTPWPLRLASLSQRISSVDILQQNLRVLSTLQGKELVV